MTVSKSMLLALIGAFASPLVASEPASRIVGGDTAEIGEYPYYVLMGGCGGSLIAPQVVLTAAHCEGRSGLNVVVGAYQRDDPTTTEGAYARKCDTWIAHPKYDDSNLSNDFALCVLDEPVELDTDVEFSLNFDKTVPSGGDVLTAVGLGTLQSGGFLASVLQEVDVPYMTNKKCKTMYGDYIKWNMLCAGLEEGGKDSCQGDSGGPIYSVAEENGVTIHTLVGVVSWGIGCALEGYPGVYARIHAAQFWIKNKVCEEWNLAADFCPEPTDPPVPEPTDPPVPEPTDPPEACVDDPTYRRDGTGKSCAQIFTGKGLDGWWKKWKKRCKRVDTITGFAVSNHCQESCSQVKQGPCAAR